MQTTEKESFEIKTKSAEETISLGARLSRFLKGGDIVALRGDLGSGKTTFVRGLVRGLHGGKGEEVTSPTFVLMHEYPGEKMIYHIDGYRLKDCEDARASGLEEFFYAGAIVVVEWAERIQALIPNYALKVEFGILGENERTLRISGESRLIVRISQELNR